MALPSRTWFWGAPVGVEGRVSGKERNAQAFHFEGASVGAPLLPLTPVGDVKEKAQGSNSSRREGNEKKQTYSADQTVPP